MDTRKYKKKDYTPNAFVFRSETYTITGDPVALARARHAEHRVYDSQKQLKLVVGLQFVNQHGDKQKFSGPVLLDIKFFMALPQKFPLSLPGSYHPYRPDLSNLIKWIEDVATGIIYKDDCIIAQINSQKLYDRNPRTEVTITSLPSKPCVIGNLCMKENSDIRKN